MAQSVPTRFGKCKTQQLLGRGATAVVYLAKHEGLDMPVAVKVLRKKLSEEKPQYAERFLREARMAARLEHPHLVRVIDCGIEDGYHYMVMDYVDGPNCLELLGGSPGGLDWREAARIIRQAAIGLAYAAEHEVIHRDVKPSNIMIDSSGRARVSDLGLAKLTMKGIVSLTQELHTVGTPNYMSPEQIRSPADLDLRTDIYSLGAT
ncbi:MAG: serine/threonine protein kinase, partial [Candidatus Brocadiae bacterium]|nr:serine/threonine protein kinase [Candidatus Brocadiia bacterium]